MKKLTSKCDIKNWIKAKNADKLRTMLRKERQICFDDGIDNAHRIERIKKLMLKKERSIRAIGNPNWKEYHI